MGTHVPHGKVILNISFGRTSEYAPQSRKTAKKIFNQDISETITVSNAKIEQLS